MLGCRGAAKNIETDAGLGKRFVHLRPIEVDEFLGGFSGFFGRDGNGNAVLIGAANVNDVTAPHALIAHVNIGRQIRARNVTDVQRPVGIRQSAGDEDFFVSNHRKSLSGENFLLKVSN